MAQFVLRCPQCNTEGEEINRRSEKGSAFEDIIVFCQCPKCGWKWERVVMRLPEKETSRGP